MSGKIEYEVIGSFLATEENAIEQAVKKLKTVLEGSKILESSSLNSASRYLIALGIYNGFFSCFEIIMQTKRASLERQALKKWQDDNKELNDDLIASYRVFRNLMTHQGYYVAGSTLVWEDVPHLDTVQPVYRFPDFLAEKVDGHTVRAYTLLEWVEKCFQKIYKALNSIEAIRREIKTAV